MELKHYHHTRKNSGFHVLIVPFMELKPKNRVPKSTCLSVLIVPFMELKLTTA